MQVKTIDEHHEWSEELYRQAGAYLRRMSGCVKGFAMDCGLPPMHTGQCITRGTLTIAETIARLDRVIVDVRRYQ